jgi:hypothetical protein
MVVDLPTLKAYIRVDTDLHDNLLEILLEGAEDYALSYIKASRATGRDVVESISPESGILWPSTCPIVAVTQVRDMDSDGAGTPAIIDSTLYDYNETSIWMTDGTFFEYGLKKWEVTLTGGMNTTCGTVTNSKNAPAAFKQAVMSLVAREYNNLGATLEQEEMESRVEWQPMNVGNDIHLMLDRIDYTRAVM